MRRFIKSRLIWIYAVCKCVFEFTWCPKLPDFIILQFQNVLKLCQLGNIKWWILFVNCCFFSKSSFWKNSSGIPSECQAVWIQVRSDDLSGLNWVQTVFKSSQTTLVLRHWVNWVILLNYLCFSMNMLIVLNNYIYKIHTRLLAFIRKFSGAKCFT